MDLLALFTSTAGRLTRKPFGYALLAVYLASFASLLLLTGAVTARLGVWPFTLVQAALAWAWTVLHVKRLRDAGRPAAGAIAVALLYALSVGFAVLLTLIVSAASAPGSAESAQGAQLGAFLLVGLLLFLFEPDFGPYVMILKVLALIACLPFVISLTFSVYAGLRRSAP